LVPRNVVLAGLEILAGRTTNDLIGEQRDLTAMDWLGDRQWLPPGHLLVKRSRQIRSVTQGKMADRGDPRVHLNEPGSIRGIKNEIESHKARQMEALHHLFRKCRHFRVIDQFDDARRSMTVLDFHNFDADPGENLALPANHGAIAGAPRYEL